MSYSQLLKQYIQSAAFIDAHCHHSSNDAVLAVENIELMTAANHHLPVFYSAGIHPWAISPDWQQQLNKLENRGGLLAIGECGLDKAIQTPLQQQWPVFEAQIKLAARWRKPLIIHCVRAFNEVQVIKKRMNTGKPWLIHGYRGSYAQLLQLLDGGFYCSFGSALLKNAATQAQYLPQLPLDRWLLETDADARIGIDEVYACAARMMGWEVDALHRQMQINFQRIFIDD